MGLTRSNSGLSRALGFIVSPVRKGEIRGGKIGVGMVDKRNRKGMEGWKEGRKGEGLKKDGRKDKKKEF